MNIMTHIRGLTNDQRNAFMASFLGWSLDAFDYFILVFVIKYIAQYYGGNYGLALVTGVFLVATIILTAVGKEAKDVQFGTGSVEPVSIPA